MNLSLLLLLAASNPALSDVISPEILLSKNYTALPTFESVATFDHLSNKSKSRRDLMNENFDSLNQDPLFQAISRIMFRWQISQASQACIDKSKILDKIESVLLKNDRLDLVQEKGGVSVVNINILNNSSGSIDDSNLKASAILGSTKNPKAERDPVLNINMILKKDGTCLAPSEKEIATAIDAISQ